MTLPGLKEGLLGKEILSRNNTNIPKHIKGVSQENNFIRRCYLVTNYNDQKSKHISAPDCFGVKDIEKVRK